MTVAPTLRFLVIVGLIPKISVTAAALEQAIHMALHARPSQEQGKPSDDDYGKDWHSGLRFETNPLPAVPPAILEHALAASSSVKLGPCSRSTSPSAVFPSHMV